jgi:hypothetical protein
VCLWGGPECCWASGGGDGLYPFAAVTRPLAPLHLHIYSHKHNTPHATTNCRRHLANVRDADPARAQRLQQEVHIFSTHFFSKLTEAVDIPPLDELIAAAEAEAAAAAAAAAEAAAAEAAAASGGAGAWLIGCLLG